MVINNSEDVIYLSEISTDECLLHTNPDCDGYQKLLVWFFELVRGSRQ